MSSLWDRFQQYYLRHEELGFSIDISRFRFEHAAQKAFTSIRGSAAGAFSLS